MIEDLLDDFESEDEVEDAEAQDKQNDNPEEDEETKLRRQLSVKAPDAVIKNRRMVTSESLIEIAKKIEDANKGTKRLHPDEEYDLVVAATERIQDIDEEILDYHRVICVKYSPRFPELEGLIYNPSEYARVVKTIGDIEDLTEVDFKSILPPQLVMSVTIMGSTTKGKKLPKEEHDVVMQAVDDVITMSNYKRIMVDFVASKMMILAPNLTCLVGSNVAAQMITKTGGLSSLVKLPACNLEVLGKDIKKNLGGFSTKTANVHAGYLWQCDVMDVIPSDLRSKAVRLLAGKCALVARCDLFHEAPQGEKGKEMRKFIDDRLKQLQEPPPARTVKPLPAPEMQSRKKRGGKRARKLKEKFAMTDLQKQQNKMKFGEPEEEIGWDDGGDETVGLGMLGQANTGKIRGSAGQSNGLKNVAKKIRTATTATSGMQSVVSFTPYQGMELVNPTKRDTTSGTATYFKETGTFTAILKK